MNNIEKFIIAAIVLLYIFSPVDLLPGPIDDIVVTLIGMVAGSRIGTTE